MSTSVVRAEDHFPQESPAFEPPLPQVVEGKIQYFTEVTEQYFQEREAMVAFWERDANALEEIVTRFSLTGGDPKLEILIEQAGRHLEQVRADFLPRIEESRNTRREAMSIKIPRVREIMTQTIDRNNALMRRYIKALEEIYNRLIRLRDLSISQSVSSLTAAAWADLWEDDD